MELSKFNLLRAILHCQNNPQQLAKLIQVTPQKIQNWLTTKEEISYEYATLIEQVTEGHVSRFDLAPHLRFSHYITYQDVGRKILLGQTYEAKVFARDKNHRNQMERYQWIAETIGLKDGNQYYQAKYVTKNSAYKLLEAMDSKTFSISFAYQIALLPLPLQEQCLFLTSEQIQERLSFYTYDARINALGFIEAIMGDRRLTTAEENAKKPLRLALLALILLRTEFVFSRDQMDESFKKNLDLPLDELLSTLQDLGWVSLTEQGRLKINYPFNQLVST